MKKKLDELNRKIRHSRKKHAGMIHKRNSLRDGPLFFIGGLPFLRLEYNFFLKSNAFQTIFFITFCNENNFFTTIFFKMLQAFYRSYLKKTLLVHAYT